MARITVEDCIDKFESRFELVLVASNRARKLHSGETPTVDKDNDKNTVIALREIADETITADEFKQNLIEEYQSVSAIDEEELALEFNDENLDQSAESDNSPEESQNTDSSELQDDLEEDINETNDDESSNDISSNEPNNNS